MLKEKIVFLGAGNMAEALISGLVSSGSAGKEKIIAADIRRERLVYLEKRYGIGIGRDNREAVRQGKIIILAVKPQQVKELLGDIGGLVKKEQLVVSIAAGIPTKYIEKFFRQKVPVVRVMPNTPALIGEGASVITAGRYARKEHLRTVRKIFSAVGYAAELPENLLNAVTALSGSGPAYIFYLVEMMKEAAKKMNLPGGIAEKLVNQTIYGAIKMLKISGESAELFRQKVTSPGGTTEAAIKYLELKKFKPIFIQALSKARARAQELTPK